MPLIVARKWVFCVPLSPNRSFFCAFRVICTYKESRQLVLLGTKLDSRKQKYSTVGQDYKHNAKRLGLVITILPCPSFDVLRKRYEEETTNVLHCISCQTQVTRNKTVFRSDGILSNRGMEVPLEQRISLSPYHVVLPLHFFLSLFPVYLYPTRQSSS
jgi:hypothetical protein